MVTDLVDDIKVEVQLPPEEGDNLLTNTSGQYGAWQWAPDGLTTDTSVTGDPVTRTITAQRGGTAGSTGIQTDHLPVTAGMYANARVDLTAITSGHKATLLLQFYDSAYDVLSWQYSSPSSTLDTLALSSVLVPASAVWSRLFVVLDKTADPNPDTGSANANALVSFTKAMVTEVTGAGVPSVVKTNLMPNGGFQYNTTGWTTGQNIEGITRVDYSGAFVLHAVLDSGVTLSNGEGSYVHGPYVTGIEEGENYSLRIDSRSDVMTDGHTLEPTMYYCWYDDLDNQVGSCTFVDSFVTDGSWVQEWRIITAPAGATKLRINPGMRHRGPTIVMGSGWDFEVDSVSVVKSSVLMPYWDGDTPDTSSHTYDWTGTAGNSPATRTSVGAVEYVEPDENFLDITGGYNNFIIERSELDISTCNGTIVDPSMSPARSDSMIVPGRGIRVSAWRPAVSEFVRLFTGTLGPCSVEYDPLNDDKREKVKISVTSTGAESTLAQASRPGVTKTPAHLGALVLARAGVPWDVDGSSNIVAGASTIADNDNATALDQVALTRDTQDNALAWVDPTGLLVFQSSPGAKSTGPATMGPTDYSASGLKVSFSTERLINSVNVVRLIRASDGSTEERQHGPYDDGASIRRWGRSSATVTIASLPDDTAAADTKAAAILAANSTPVLVIEEVAINSADERDHAFHDLYDLLTVSADTIDGAVVADTRITRLRHEFTTEARPFGRGQGRWKTTYGFMAEGGVASPAIQPPLTSGGDNSLEQPASGTLVDRGLTLASGWAVGSNYVVKVGHVVQMYLNLTRTGATISAGATGNIGNITVATLGDDLDPILPGALVSSHTGPLGTLVAGDNGGSAGTLSLPALAPNVNWNSGDTYSFGGCYIAKTNGWN